MRKPLTLLIVALVGALSTVSTAQDPAPAPDPDPQPRPQTAPSEPELPPNVLYETFEEIPTEPAWILAKHGPDSSAAPTSADGGVTLLTGGKGENNSVAWPLTADGEYREVKAEVVFTIDSAAHGMSLMLLNTARCGRKGPAFQLYKQLAPPGKPRPATPTWDEPNVWGSFAVALDTDNPPNDDMFDANGNVHKRPEREVSLHWDGREVANAFCEFDYVTGEAAVLTVHVDFVTGGAEVTVGVGGQAVYDAHFIPDMLPFESRAAIGAFGPTGGTCTVDSVRVEWNTEAAETPSPISVSAFRDVWHETHGKAKPERVVDLLPDGIAFERVIMHMTLEPMVVRDEWDRLGHVFVWDGDPAADDHKANATRFEIARILTPFMMWGESYEYICDVTDFAALLTGRRRIATPMGSNVGHGFCIDLSFTYYRRPADVAPLPSVVSVANVWNGNAKMNDDESMAKVFGVRAVDVPAGASGAKLRIIVTGHGKLEFKPWERAVRVGETAFENRLWTQDCYLNPWRPQFGTWKFDRAGWGPGSFGRVWEIDVTDLITPGQPLELEYTSPKFEEDGWANHVIESQIVFYAD